MLFYVVYAVFAKTAEKKTMDFSDLKSFDINSVSDEIIVNLIDDIYIKYKEEGGNGRVAKSQEFIRKIDEILDKQEATV